MRFLTNISPKSRRAFDYAQARTQFALSWHNHPMPENDEYPAYHPRMAEGLHSISVDDDRRDLSDFWEAFRLFEDWAAK